MTSTPTVHEIAPGADVAVTRPLAPEGARAVRRLGLLTEEFGAYSTVFVQRQLDALGEFAPFVGCWIRSNRSVFDYEPVHLLRDDTWHGRLRAWCARVLPRRYGVSERIAAARPLRAALRRYRPEHLLIHFGWTAARVVDLLEHERVPFTLFLHGSDLNEAFAHPEHPYARRLLRAIHTAERCLTVSEDLRQKCLALGVPREQVEVFYLGVPIPNDAVIPRPEAGGRIIANGRLIPWKGHRHLLDALALLAGRGLRPRLTLIGEGQLDSELRAQAERLGIAAQIDFAGRCANTAVFAHLRESDVLAHPSLKLPTGEEEGLGLAVQEAMAIGLPVVGTATGGIPESIVDGETGYLVPPADAPRMADALERLLTDGDLCRGLGAAGRVRARTFFDLRERNAELLRRMRGVMSR